MTWYWILLLVIIYLFGIGVSGAIFDNDECEDDKVAGFGIGLIWPVWMISYLGYVILKKYKQKRKVQ